MYHTVGVHILLSGKGLYFLIFYINMNDKIKQLFKEDVADRKAANLQERLPEIRKRDKIRAKKLRKILDELKGGLGELDAQSLFYAGFIFHHQGTKRATIQARSLARRGVKICKGKNTKACKQVRWLYAGSTDRLLMLSDKPQKYGTQYKRKKNKNGFYLYKVDPKTTDEERKSLNVPTITEAKKLAKNI